MLQQNIEPAPSSTTEQPASAPMADAAPAISQDDVAAQAIYDALQGESPVRRQIRPRLTTETFLASPAFSMSGNFDVGDFLTSPLGSPLDDEMLTTPALGDVDMTISPTVFTSPAMFDMNGGFDEMPLFGDMPGYESLEPKAGQRSLLSSAHPAVFDSMYTMSSPDTPFLDPTSLHSSPVDTSTARRRVAPTGTRKNVTPESLVPLSAPIQPRKYLTPSQTSRKELPATFARKRARSQAFDDEDEAPPPSLSEEDAIKTKRLQNTLAARRSRKRKLEYQRELEDAVEHERREKEMWRGHALVLEALLRDKGHDVPRIEDA